jgi:K+-transporting ATPase c subunit
MFKVAIISKEMAENLIGQKFNNTCYFNPILDANNNFVLSEEEIKQSNNTELLNLKLIEYQPKQKPIKL